MSSTAGPAAGATDDVHVAQEDLKLEAVVIPVADPDRSKAFYTGLGWRLDADFAFDNDFRVIQLTPPGSGASVQFGSRITPAAPGSAHGLYLIVSDIDAARDELAELGAEISEVFHPGAPGAQFAEDSSRSSGRARGRARDLRLIRDLQRPRRQRMAVAGGHDAASRAGRRKRHSIHVDGRSRERDAARVGCARRAREARAGGRIRRELARLVRRLHGGGAGRDGAADMSTPLIASIEPGFRTIDGLRIRFADSGGPQEPVLLLTSPWPESLYAFTPMWPALAEHARLFAVDLPGFGASEARDDLYSPRAMGEFLAELVVEADLGTPFIVAPDVGTSAALFAAAAHPDRIAGVIVGSGGAAVPLELGEPLRSRVLDPDIDQYRTMDPRAIVDGVVDKVAGGVPDYIRADYRDCYAGERYVESMRYVRRYPEELPELAELLPQITMPVTLINGRNDWVVPLANVEFLAERLPNSRLAIIDGGHFVWEEAPAEYAAEILASIAARRE